MQAIAPCHCNDQVPSARDLDGAILSIYELNADWLHRITNFEPSMLEPTVFGPLDTVLDKFIAEYVGYLRLMSLTGVSALSEPARAAADEVSGYVRSEHTLLKVARMPDAVIGSADQMLVSMGMRSPEFEQQWSAFVPDSQGPCSEVIPTRRLRRQWAHEIVTGASQAWTADQMTGSILCERNANVMSLTASDFYCITHSVWYVTDYGRRELPSFVDSLALSELIDQSVAHSLAEGNLDLVVEFLMAIIAGRLQWSRECQLAWRILWSAWRSHAFVPGYGFRQETYLNQVGDEKERYQFATSQHTTRVFGKLCCLMIQFPARWGHSDRPLSDDGPEQDAAELVVEDNEGDVCWNSSDYAPVLSRALSGLEDLCSLPDLCDLDLSILIEGLAIRMGRSFDLEGLQGLQGLRLSPKTTREIEALTRLKPMLTRVHRHADASA